MAVVVAGNATLGISSHVCPFEGCDGPGAKGRNDPAYFYWSDNSTTSGWLAQTNTSIPCDHEDPKASWVDYNFGVGTCADVVIWEKWTVVLDVSTPFLNRLRIRGTLIALQDPAHPIEIHANMIDIQGGKLIIGNATHPFLGPMARIILHGDMYMHGKMCPKPIDPDVSVEGCGKKIKVNGELSLNGRPYHRITLPLFQDATAGSCDPPRRARRALVPSLGPELDSAVQRMGGGSRRHHLLE